MSLFSIGLSGLNTAQNALTTVSHNMSNSATEGYTRQNTIIASAGGQYTSQGFFGQGSRTTTVMRVYDQFLTGQLRGAQSASAALSTYSQQISQIDNLLADQKGGISPLMQQFFASVQGASDTPADPAARQAMISSGQALVGQVRSVASYFDQLQSGVNEQLGTAVTQVNAYTTQIANLNKQITTLQGASGGQPANDLLDQRDQAVADLSKLLGVKVVVQDGGTYNITMGNGQPLVMGESSYNLQAVASAADPTRTTIAYTLPNGKAVEAEEGLIQGGSLGGLLQYRTETLDSAQNAIGRLSLALGQAFNDQHAQGLDLNGAAGGDFFSIGSPITLANANNTGSALATTTISDTSALTTSNYKVSYDGTNYTLTRLSDNKVVASAGGTGAQTLSADGIDVQISAGMSASDSFLVKPTSSAAGSFDMALSDPAKIALGSVADGAGAVSSNGNGLLLAKLQTAKTINGVSSFNDAYAQLVNDVGTKAMSVQIASTSQDSITSQIQTAQQSVSGVNMDEETVSMLRFQQLYQANARVIQTATTVFDTILGIGN